MQQSSTVTNVPIANGCIIILIIAVIVVLIQSACINNIPKLACRQFFLSTASQTIDINIISYCATVITVSWLYSTLVMYQARLCCLFLLLSILDYIM